MCFGALEERLMKKLLIITGASRGIGKATAGLFKSNDWQVINLARQICDLDSVINLSVDLTDLRFMEFIEVDMFKYLKSAEQICLVHNSCVYDKGTVATIDPKKFRSILEVNLVAPLILNRLIVPYMKAGSSIVYMGSTLSEKAVANSAPYVISKHASVGMMRATCQDLVTQQIHTACVCPGFTETEMLKQHVGSDPALLEHLSARVGAHRLIQPTEIADLVLYVANNPVLNGSVLHANLGQIES